MIEHITGNNYRPVKSPHNNYILKSSNNMHGREKEPESDNRGILSGKASEESNRALDFNWIETFVESWTMGDQV